MNLNYTLNLTARLKQEFFQLEDKQNPIKVVREHKFLSEPTVSDIEDFVREVVGNEAEQKKYNIYVNVEAYYSN